MNNETHNLFNNQFYYLSKWIYMLIIENAILKLKLAEIKQNERKINEKIEEQDKKLMDLSNNFKKKENKKINFEQENKFQNTKKNEGLEILKKNNYSRSLSINENYIKKKRIRKKKSGFNIPRKDNIFKQIKIQALKFSILTLNENLEGIIDRFHRFTNTINKDLKDNIQKNKNIDILNLKLKEILIYHCENDINEKLIKIIEEKYKNNQKNKQLSFIKYMLNMTFNDIIKMFDMNDSQFIEQYGFKNKYLLINCKFKNKEDMQNLIKFDMMKYMSSKYERKSKKIGIND